MTFDSGIGSGHVFRERGDVIVSSSTGLPTLIGECDSGPWWASRLEGGEMKLTVKKQATLGMSPRWTISRASQYEIPTSWAKRRGEIKRLWLSDWILRFCFTGHTSQSENGAILTPRGASRCFEGGRDGPRKIGRCFEGGRTIYFSTI